MLAPLRSPPVREVPVRDLPLRRPAQPCASFGWRNMQSSTAGVSGAMWIPWPDILAYTVPVAPSERSCRSGSWCGQPCPTTSVLTYRPRSGLQFALVIGCSSELKVAAGISYFSYIDLSHEALCDRCAEGSRPPQAVSQPEAPCHIFAKSGIDQSLRHSWGFELSPSKVLFPYVLPGPAFPQFGPFELCG